MKKIFIVLATTLLMATVAAVAWSTSYGSSAANATNSTEYHYVGNNLIYSAAGVALTVGFRTRGKPRIRIPIA
jgi:hypothetical protein